MRLLQLHITECRSVVEGVLPLEGLVVLFGPNSGGKSTILEATRELLGAKGQLRRDPGDDGGDPYAMGSIWFDLPAAGLSGSADERLMRDLLVGAFADQKTLPWTDLDAETPALLADATLEEAKRYLIDLLVEHGSAGDPEDRAILAAAAFDAPLFHTDGLDISLVVHHYRLDDAARAAAARIAEGGLDEKDDLSCAASGLTTNKAVELQVLGDRGDRLLHSAVPVITLDGDPARLAAEVELALPRIHDLLWGLLKEQMTVEQRLFEVVDDFLLSTLVATPDQLLVDSWLEVLVEEPEGDRVTTPRLFGRYDVGDWSRVRRSLLVTARVLSEHANRLAPAFVGR